MVKIKKIRKRDGRIVDFDPEKITNAIFKAAQAVGGRDRSIAENLTKQVVEILEERLKPGEIPAVEQVQDIIEKVLVENGHYKTAKAFILYRRERTWIREEKKRLLQKEAIDEVDKKFSVSAVQVLVSRYLLKDEEGKLIESPKQLFQRVASLIVIPDILHDKKIFDKKGKQRIKPVEEFNPIELENKLGLKEIKWNRWHLESMKSLYDELNSQGKMKVSWKEFLKMLEKGEFENYYQNFLDYYNLMVEKKFLPNSPTLFNAGARLSQLSACFVLGMEDDMRSIMEAGRDAATIFQSGGGIGINFSKLRPAGDVVASTVGVASGPVSFAKIIDTITDVVKQGGKRRGACMGILEISHPDIEKFISVKETPGVLENFNLSVLVFPEFFDAYERDEMYPLINPRTKKVWKYVNAKYLLNSIAMSAWKSGDPGVVFFDNLNRRNVLLKTKGPIRSTNPCVSGDTIIVTNEGLIPISSLHNPQQVLGKDGEFHVIRWVGKTGKKEVYLIETENGLRLKATLNHMFLTKNNEWKELGKLKKGEEVVTFFNNRFYTAPVKKIEKVGIEEVYDLKEPVTHSFIANNFVVHNCGEEPLYEYESCNLGSINLYAHFKEDNLGNKTFNWEELKRSIKLATRFLDNVIDMNKYPFEKIEKTTKEARKIGLGVMGLADTLFAMQIPYNSEEGIELMRKLIEFVTFHAMLESSQLAAERGVFPIYDDSSYPKELPIEGYYQPELWTQDWKEVVRAIKANGIRNAEVTTIAPTGSLSMLADVSSGIEPQYALVFEKIVTIGSFFYTDVEFERQLKLSGLYEDEILKRIRENGGSVQGIEEIPLELRKTFITALDIPWWDHVRAQAEIAKWVCAATSKTINMPNWVTPEDVKNAFLFAYKLGCKGITIYREGSKARQVLYSPEAEVRNRQKEVMKLIKNKTLQMMKKFKIELPEIHELEEEQPKRRVEIINYEKEGKCPECKSSRIVKESGCIKCLDCGWSVCIVG
ncbi:MAG: ribonucleotide reductase N-terminal alpha domain-containing protein [Candidatus Aenigmarchaeota archaeon]|nr:ribonucleotide reductase N-terminal alpha domain-containing protein [Candidatus Aenigmarchaeota archaeon]